MNFVFFKNTTPAEFEIEIGLKIWGIIPRFVDMTIGGNSSSFVPHEAQKDPFTLSVSHDKKELYKIKVEGYSQLTVALVVNGDGKNTFSFHQRLSTDEVVESEDASDAALIDMMKSQSYYDILQVGKEHSL